MTNYDDDVAPENRLYKCDKCGVYVQYNDMFTAKGFDFLCPRCYDEITFGTPHKKYFRARISSRCGEFKGFKTLDSTSYTNMKEFACDIRGNGYRTSIIVEITDPFEMRVIQPNTTLSFR